MKIEEKYRQGLKKLMKTTPLDEINVVMLSNAIKSNRQTFYYHYRDLSDVIESIFLKERIGYGTKTLDFENIIKPLIAYINSNFSFLFAVSSSFAEGNLLNFMYSYFSQKTTQYFKTTKKEESINQSQLTCAIRYISSLFSSEIVFWISSKRKERQTHLQKRLTLLWNYIIDVYPKEMEAIK